MIMQGGYIIKKTMIEIMVTNVSARLPPKRKLTPMPTAHAKRSVKIVVHLHCSQLTNCNADACANPKSRTTTTLITSKNSNSGV